MQNWRLTNVSQAPRRRAITEKDATFDADYLSFHQLETALSRLAVLSCQHCQIPAARSPSFIAAQPHCTPSRAPSPPRTAQPKRRGRLALRAGAYFTDAECDAPHGIPFLRRLMCYRRCEYFALAIRLSRMKDGRCRDDKYVGR